MVRTPSEAPQHGESPSMFKTELSTPLGARSCSTILNMHHKSPGDHQSAQKNLQIRYGLPR